MKKNKEDEEEEEKEGAEKRESSLALKIVQRTRSLRSRDPGSRDLP